MEPGMEYLVQSALKKKHINPKQYLLRAVLAGVYIRLNEPVPSHHS